MAGEWDDMAGGYRNEFVKLLWKHTGLNPQDKRIVVDFGCGTGLLTQTLRSLSPESEFICIDAAPAMVRVLQEKIQSCEWNGNVRAHNVALANLDSADEGIRLDLEGLRGKVDLVVASSVMTFIPAEDLPGTMKVLGGLLKPETGIFVHSDWPKNEEKHPDGMTEESAIKMYGYGDLTKESTEATKVTMGDSFEADVFIGVAKRT